MPGGDAQPGERARPGAVLRPRRRAAVRAARRVAGHADDARRRHRRQGVHRHQRLRRGVHARAARHVGVLPARLQQRQHREGRPLPPHPASASKNDRAARRGARRLLRRSRLRAHRAQRPRDAAAGAALLGGLGDRSAGAASTADFFRLAADSYYVPISMAVPGSARARARRARTRSQLDVLGCCPRRDGARPSAASARR